MLSAEPERLLIVGAGTIACGLSAVAMHRLGAVTLWTRSDDSAARARQRIEAIAGRMGHGLDRERLVITTDLEIEDRTFVVEAVAEDAAVKRQVLSRLDGIASRDVVIATTTSSLALDSLAEVFEHPKRFVAFHVFNPVERMNLVEIAGEGSTSAAAVERARALATALGKTPIDVPPVPGFVVNRVLFPYLFAAAEMASRDDLDASDIDACLTLGANMPIGPLALLDLIGLDVAESIGQALGLQVPELLRDLVASGRLGRKSGEGLSVR